MNWASIQEEMRRHGVDLLIATSPENIRYATGYKPFQWVWNRFGKAALVTENSNRPTLILPISEAPSVADEPDVDHYDAIFFGAPNLVMPDSAAEMDEAERWIATAGAARENNIVSAVLAALRRWGPKGRVAVDQTGAPEICAALTVADDAYTFVPGGEDLWRLGRMIKTPDEVEKMRRAVVLNERAIDAVWAKLGEVTETELASVYAAEVTRSGGSVQHFVGGSGRKAGSYRGPRPVVPKRGERFRLDAGLELDGYCSDLGGTAQIAAEPTAGESATYAALACGIEEGLRCARPGTRASELYAKVIEAIRKGGLPQYKCTLAGHGIGIEPRDYPILGAPMKISSPFMGAPFDPEIRAGMVLNIETPLNILTHGSFQYEVTLLVENDGGRLLSRRRSYDAVWPS